MRLRCKLGWHRWSGWQFIEHIDVPMRRSDHGTIRITHMGIKGDYYERACTLCNAEEDKLDRAPVITQMIKSGEVKAP